MTIMENLLSRFGYVKLDPYRRELLARAEVAAGIAPGQTAPPPLALAPPRPVAPPVPPPRQVRPHDDHTVVDPRPPAADDNESEEEWEWRLAMARARAREDQEAPAAESPYVPTLPRPAYGAPSRRPKGLPPHRRLPLSASQIREGWKR